MIPRRLLIFGALTLLVSVHYCVDPAIEDEELSARSFLKYLNKKSKELFKKSANAEWAYASNITKENLAKKVSILVNISGNIFYTVAVSSF